MDYKIGQSVSISKKILDSNSSKNNSEKSPYEILGVEEGAAFEDIQKARDIKVKEAGEDLILKAKIESSLINYSWVV